MSSIASAQQTKRAAYPSVAQPIGLLAGSGRFPILFAEAARRQGLPVACVGIKYEVPDELRGLCDSFHVVGIAKLGRNDPRLSPSGRQADRHGGQGHQERDVHALENGSALSRPADDPVVVSRPAGSTIATTVFCSVSSPSSNAMG